MYRKLILLISLTVQILTAQEFSLSWIDQDAAGKAASLKKSYGISRINSSVQGSGVDIKFHRITLTLDPAVRLINGSVSTYFVSKQEDLHSIIFDMHDSLKVTAIRYHGEHLSNFTHQNNKLIIQLPGQPITDNRQPVPLIRYPAFTKLDSIMIDYQGIPVDDGGGSFTLSKHDSVPILYTSSEPYGAKDWWPCSQDLNDKIDSVHLVISVPPGNRAAANGMLISEQHFNDRSIYQWKHKHPIAAYLIGIAVTNYAVYSDFVPLENGDSIEILNYVYPETLDDTRARTPNLIRPFQWFNQWFGLYPYADERYGHAQWNWGGGMEHQTMSFMGSFGYELMVHELGHQWFGDFLTCASWRDIWLNEGFATYMSGLCYEREPGGIYWEPFKRLTINRIIREPGGSVYCYDTTNVDRIFDPRLSYSKGAMVLHMLRWEMGDENFFKAMNNYLYDPLLANGYASTEDFIRHAEAVADTSFREFFNDWVYGAGYPKYQVIYRLLPDDEVELEISQEPSDPSVSFFEMDLPVRLYGDGTTAELRSRSGGVPAFAGMTRKGSVQREGVPAFAGMTRKGSVQREGVPAFAGMTRKGSVQREGVPAFAGMTRKGSVQREGVPAFAGMTSASYVTVVLKHSYNGQVFRVHPGFKVDSVKFDPERWICTANPLVLNVTKIPYNLQINIYPNPVSDKLTVELPMPQEGLTIRIYNQKGQLMHTERSDAVSSRIQIPMHSFARGVYTVEVEGRGRVKVVKE